MSSCEVDTVKGKGMFHMFLENMTRDSLMKCGVTMNGPDKADLQVRNERMYYRLLKFAVGLDRLAVGETYMDGDWDCDDLVTLFEKMFENQRSFKRYYVFLTLIPKLMHKTSVMLFNMQSKSQSAKDISAHYDIGNDLYRLMLDRSMNYSCGYWQKNVPINSREKATLCANIDEAQMNKMLLIGKKLNLKPGMRVLDIGCGWGYLAKFLAINFGVHVVAITISKEQHTYAMTTDLEANELAFLRVPTLTSSEKGSFEFRLQDYRDVTETFDRIVSVGMFEHVGVGNYDEYFQVCRRCLKDNGILLLHTIGIGYTLVNQVDPWVNKYIFPGGVIPYHTQIVDATLNKFLIEDWHNFGYDYYRTLCAWKANFDRNWPKLQGKYDERFRRMWTFYLCSGAAAFKKRKLNLWQIVLSKKGLDGGFAGHR